MTWSLELCLGHLTTQIIESETETKLAWLLSCTIMVGKGVLMPGTSGSCHPF